jgi:hypothetical protein
MLETVTYTVTTSFADESDYDYYIDRENASPVLVIIDLDRGGKSVTNNIKAILNSIAAVENFDLTMPIIYKDSDGNYDGVRIDESGTISFYPLVIGQCVTNEHEAIKAVIAMQKI